MLALGLAGPAAANFPASVETTLPPGGTAQITSPALPAAAKQASVDIAPTGGRKPIFERLQILFATTKSKKARLLTCIYLYAVTSNSLTDPETPVSFQGTDQSLAVLFLAACAEIAEQTVADPSAASAASSPCKQAKRSAPIAVRSTGSGYSVTIDGTSKRTNRAVPVRVVCKPKGSGVRLTVRPRSPKKTLRQVVGPTLGVGLASPADAAGSVAVKATYAQPR